MYKIKYKKRYLYYLAAVLSIIIFFLPSPGINKIDRPPFKSSSYVSYSGDTPKCNGDNIDSKQSKNIKNFGLPFSYYVNETYSSKYFCNGENKTYDSGYLTVFSIQYLMIDVIFMIFLFLTFKKYAFEKK
jgi:hypothetical protein